MRQAKRRTPKRRKQRSKVTPSAARTMLKALREFIPDFASISLSEGGMTISVTAHGAKPSKEQAAAMKAQTEKPKLTAIGSLSKPEPVFQFEEN